MTNERDLIEQATIRDRFTLVIPKKIRERINLEEQEPVEITIKDGSIVITPIRDNIFEKLNRYADGIEYNRKAREEAEQELLNQVE